jgi:MHS family proline/betaine transporter-like MFS transporter
MHEAAPTTAIAPPRQSAGRTALAGLIGNVLEWFDFAVYGYFASDIGSQFFPRSNPTAQQLLTFTVFAIGYAARPVGSIVLGPVGDRIGRKALLTLSIAVMGAATLGIGLLPTYAQIGLIAPILLMFLRLVQGFSVGAEFTGSMVYTTELSTPERRGLISSSTAAGTTMGFILGSGSAWLVNTLLGGGDAVSWRWRIPFIASVLLCGLGWTLRAGLHESAEGAKASAARPPLFASLAADWLPMLRTFGIISVINAAYYLTFTYVAERRAHLGGASYLLANTISLFVVLGAKVLGGWLSDRVGRRRLSLLVTAGLIVFIYPALQVMLTGSATAFTAAQMVLAVPIGMAFGLQGAMVVELFPLRTRVTSMSLAYSLTLALTGGTTPLISAWLIDVVGQQLAPAYYIMILGIIGVLLMLPMPETNGSALDR